MDSLDWERVKNVFGDAIELAANERAEFLDRSCNSDDALRAEVESLLAAADSDEPLIEKHAFDLVSRATETTDYRERVFGNYRIIRQLGSGGMGSVFLAERSDGAFAMQVALKIVRQSIADSEMIERFRQERQILATLHHPNIAALLDGGLSEKGEPFLAMEYVDGETLTDHCRVLSLEDKLRISLKVCTAVSFAHRNLVVHRDLKPANILVTTDGEPKLLDFGLAKVFQTDGQNSQTVLRAFTPGYASPEQIRGDKITTASDVYSLGVVLYELLTGVKPLNVENKSYEEILETIVNVEPPPPSARTESPGNIRAAAQWMRGDLDNIVLMALNKEPERRYRSVEAFADDIEAYLNGRPVSARPNTLSYRASKFLARNRIAATAAALILLVVVTGLAVSYRQYRETERQRSKAEDVRGFLQKMLLTAVPDASSGKSGDFDPSINLMLEQAAARLEAEDLSSQPEVKAELQFLIGSIYLRQGQVEQSSKYLKIALKTADMIPDKDLVLIARLKAGIASAEFAKANYGEAEALFEETIPVLRSALANGLIAGDDVVPALSDSALLKRARGDSRLSEILFREALQIAENFALDSSFSKNMWNYIGLNQADQGKFDEAQSGVEPIIIEARKTGDRSIAFANSLTFLGFVLLEKGDFNGADKNLKESEEVYRKLYAADSIYIFDNLRLQAQVAYLAGEPQRTLAIVEKVLENYQKNASPKFNSFGSALTIKGQALNKLGRFAEAESTLREAVRLRTENLPEGHYMTALTVGALGECLSSQKKYGEAETLLRKSLESLQQSQEPGSPRILTAQARINANRSAVSLR